MKKQCGYYIPTHTPMQSLSIPGHLFCFKLASRLGFALCAWLPGPNLGIHGLAWSAAGWLGCRPMNRVRHHFWKKHVIANSLTPLYSSLLRSIMGPDKFSNENFPLTCFHDRVRDIFSSAELSKVYSKGTLENGIFPLTVGLS